MTIATRKWVVYVACCFTAACPALSWQAVEELRGVKRIYVGGFTIKAETEKLREDIVAQLRKLSSISVISDQTSSDAVLTGNGEIWIKGYQSLNPRSGRLPSNGTPVYAGFLSVELKDPKGETLWSYLVTSAAGSEDISKDLSKQIAKHLAEALAQRKGRSRVSISR